MSRWITSGPCNCKSFICSFSLLIQSFVSGSIKGFTLFRAFLLRINSHRSNNYKLNLIYLTRIILGICSCEILSEKTSNPSATYQISTLMDSILFLNPVTKGGISTLYNVLSCLNGATSLDHLKTGWINDLGTVITDELWTGALRRMHSSSVRARHGLLQFKVLHRLHLLKVKLCRTYPNINPACDRRGQSPASLAHMFWHCPRIAAYWQRIFQSFSDIIGRVIDPKPLTTIFGVKEPDLVLSNSQYNMITFISLLGRRLIVLNWKQARPRLTLPF